MFYKLVCLIIGHHKSAHDYEYTHEGKCYAERKCKRCGKIFGTRMEHIGKWKYIDENKEKQYRKCGRCGKEETKTVYSHDYDFSDYDDSSETTRSKTLEYMDSDVAAYKYRDPQTGEEWDSDTPPWRMK